MNGIVIYNGPSLWDGEPIVVIVTGIARRSQNPKTGDMLQTWILREDMHPVEALQSGADASICGDCPMRPDDDGHRACYVSMNAPGAVYKAYRAGNYESVDPEEAGEIVGSLYPQSRRKVRIGAYGDPAMVPADVWRSLIRHAKRTTGYTHQWRTMPTEYREFCMASCDTEQDVEDAQALGYRTFRCKTEHQEPMRGEIVCPASEEAGRLTTCDQCGLCSGAMQRSNRIPSVTITVHGRGAKYFSGDHSPDTLGKDSECNADTLEQSARNRGRLLASRQPAEGQASLT